MSQIFTQVLRHKLCDLIIKTSDEAVLGVDFMPFKNFKPQPNALANAVAEQLQNYLDAKDADFSPFVLDFARELSPFALSVYEALAHIPYGERWPYKEMGFLLRSRAYQAIGSTLGRNPFLIILPCHRIIRSDATLGHYSSALGDSGKALLCEHESRCLERTLTPKFISSTKFKHL